jgi:hypothetical protein
MSPRAAYVEAGMTLVSLVFLVACAAIGGAVRGYLDRKAANKKLRSALYYGRSPMEDDNERERPGRIAFGKLLDRMKGKP